MRPPRTVVFWGAGATAALGFKTTYEQAKALQRLAFDPCARPLAQRVRLAANCREPWCSAFQDMLTILGDGSEGGSKFDVNPSQLMAMRRNSRMQADEEELRQRITNLRVLYDWPALQASLRACPPAGGFKLNDLFNLLDLHGQSGHGFPTAHDEKGGSRFLTPQEVVGARNALKMLLQAMLYVDWQVGRKEQQLCLSRHYEFAKAIGLRMQQQGKILSQSASPDSRDFYVGDVSFVSLNYDPVALWCQFVANRDLNRSPSVPHIGSPAVKLQVFHDLGHFVSGSRVNIRKCGKVCRDPRTPWHPMNESSAQRLNDPDHGSSDRIRITKFLFPHGCLWWRECPNCGKLSSYMGQSWERDSATLIPPPPLKAFVEPVDALKARYDEERKAWERGEVDARACVHCQTLTYAHHTQTRMQSSFKGPAPPFLEEIGRDMRVAVQEACHVIFMGYSLPLDDVELRAFFAARRQRIERVRCSVVGGPDGDGCWLGPSEWSGRLSAMEEGKPPRTTLEAARDLFGEDNVRFYGGGVPQVFLEGGLVTEAAVERLLNWEAP